MTPDTTFQPFPTSTFPSSPITTPSTTLNSRNPLGYNFLIKDPRESYYGGNPRYDLFSQPPNNLLYSYYPNFYSNNNLYSSTDYLMNNSRRNIYGFNNNLPYLNNTINPYIIKETITNPFDNILGSTTCSQALKANSLLSDELLSNTDLSDTTDILSPIILPEAKEEKENLIHQKIEKEPSKPLSSISSIKTEKDNMKNMKKGKKGKNESTTTSIEKLSIREDKKLKLQKKNKIKKGRNENNKKKDTFTINSNSKPKHHQNIINMDKPSKKSFSYLSSETSSPLLTFTCSPSSINTSSLHSPCSSLKSFSFDDLTSISTSSDDYHSCSNTNIDLGSFSSNTNSNSNIDLDSFSSNSNSNSNSFTYSCSNPNSNLQSQESNSIINITLNKKPKRKGGNSKGRKRPNHPHKVTRILKEWLTNNSYPYPSNTEKSRLCDATGLTM
ncbi:hypothetical protein PIROE2DRAFT_7717, partial [Piromyces sp. E2]